MYSTFYTIYIKFETVNCIIQNNLNTFSLKDEPSLYNNYPTKLLIALPLHHFHGVKISRTFFPPCTYLPFLFHPRCAYFSRARGCSWLFLQVVKKKKRKKEWKKERKRRPDRFERETLKFLFHGCSRISAD